jgi:hydroxyethylthiazole kinase-like uncharacterized protein yjeF
LTEAASRPARDRPVLIGAAEMAEIDQAAQRLGLTGDALMESAGAAVAEVAQVELARLSAELPEPPLSVVLCGPGNNGGDGFVVARRLAAAGRRVLAVLVGDAGRIDGPAAAHNWAVLQAMAAGGSLELFVAPSPDLLLVLRPRLSPATLLVDALLGSGASGPLREPIGTAVDLLNAIRTHALAASRPCGVLAVDTPTLIDMTNGSRSDPVVTADLTVSFHRAKAGFALDKEARLLAGRYFVAPIGIPLEAEEGIVPPDGAYPPSRISQINWEEPVPVDERRARPGEGVGAGPGIED